MRADILPIGTLKQTVSEVDKEIGGYGVIVVEQVAENVAVVPARRQNDEPSWIVVVNTETGRRTRVCIAEDGDLPLITDAEWDRLVVQGGLMCVPISENVTIAIPPDPGGRADWIGIITTRGRGKLTVYEEGDLPLVQEDDNPFFRRR